MKVTSQSIFSPEKEEIFDFFLVQISIFSTSVIGEIQQ